MSDDNKQQQEFARPVRLDRQSRRGPVSIEDAATAEECAAIAALIGAERVAKLRLAGQLVPVDKDGWQLRMTVGATVTQACVVSLAPVKTRVDVDVTRIYAPQTALASAEVDIDPEALEEVEPVPDTLDLAAVAIEELVLALPTYPRAPDVDEVTATAAPKGAAPLDPGSEKPFAALAELREKMQRNGGDG